MALNALWPQDAMSEEMLLSKQPAVFVNMPALPALLPP